MISYLAIWLRVFILYRLLLPKVVGFLEICLKFSKVSTQNTLFGTVVAVFQDLSDKYALQSCTVGCDVQYYYDFIQQF